MHTPAYVTKAPRSVSHEKFPEPSMICMAQVKLPKQRVAGLESPRARTVVFPAGISLQQCKFQRTRRMGETHHVFKLHVCFWFLPGRDPLLNLRSGSRSEDRRLKHLPRAPWPLMFRFETKLKTEVDLTYWNIQKCVLMRQTLMASESHISSISF